MSYAEIIVRDCYVTYITEKYLGFPEILFLATKMHALKIQYRGITHGIVFVRFIHCQKNDTSYCKTMRHHTPIKHVFAKTKCFVLRYRAKTSMRTN